MRWLVVERLAPDSLVKLASEARDKGNEPKPLMAFQDGFSGATRR